MLAISQPSLVAGRSHATFGYAVKKKGTSGVMVFLGEGTRLWVPARYSMRILE